jgi:lytic cellulose monooxygenase (C1-hydroxylating)
MLTSKLVAVLLSIPSLVAAHGYLKYIDAGGKRYEAWQVHSDPYLPPPPPVRYARKIQDEGPVIDFTSKNIT